VIGRALDNFVRCENKPSMLRSLSAEAKSVNTRINFETARAALLTRFSANLTLCVRRRAQIAANARPFVVFNGAIFLARTQIASPRRARRKLFLAGETDCGKEGKKHLSSARVKEGSGVRVLGGDECRWIAVGAA
jgi:hypothetical protein